MKLSFTGAGSTAKAQTRLCNYCAGEYLEKGPSRVGIPNSLPYAVGKRKLVGGAYRPSGICKARGSSFLMETSQGATSRLHRHHKRQPRRCGRCTVVTVEVSCKGERGWFGLVAWWPEIKTKSRRLHVTGDRPAPLPQKRPCQFTSFS